VADTVERLERQLGPLAWTTLQPADPAAAALASLRRNFLRQLHPEAAVWTIEQGATRGHLHANIIHPAAAALPRIPGITWHEPRIDNVRAVAAYVSKPSQIPDRAAWPGRCWGTAGPLWAYLRHSCIAPLVAAAAIEADLVRAAPPPPPGAPPPRLPPHPHAYPDDRRARTLRHFPRLAAILAAAAAAAQND